jgi:hypothetical protein
MTKITGDISLPCCRDCYFSKWLSGGVEHRCLVNDLILNYGKHFKGRYYLIKLPSISEGGCTARDSHPKRFRGEG